MKFISLFSGIGGFDLGFERAGMECVAQVEKDKNCLQLLDDKFPNAEKHTDVKEFDYGKSIDVITGGFPCQDVSVAGRRAGLAGERSGLWHEFHRIIASSLPRWVVIENVPGLLSSNDGKDFAVILRGLVECGYGVAWRILDAQYFGVPQRRRRVFIVGSLGNGRAAKVLFESEGVRGDIAKGREAWKDFAPVAGTLSANGGGLDRPAGNANELDFCIPEIANTLGKGNRYNATDGETFAISGIGENKEGTGTLRANGGDLGGGSEMLVARSLTASNQRIDFETENFVTAYNIQHNDGGSHKRKDRPNGGLYVNETETALTVGTTDMTAIAYKIRGGGGQGGKGYLGSEKTPFSLSTSQDQYLGVRRLTPVECERLQGFPDSWTAGFADTVRYRMLGNAVAVPCAEWIGRRIMEAS